MGVHAHGFWDDEAIIEADREDIARAEELWALFGWDQWERPSKEESEVPKGKPSSSSCSR
jgi:hypothetical protein